ncbi:DUF4065 domain-containing protein [bacterium]|nr:DUF4065 domain-containing protein [bacterium]
MKAMDITSYFLSCVDEEAGDFMTNMKLQKLLYYAQGFSLALFDKPLFEEIIKAWEHGPVVPSVYHYFKDNGSGPIKIHDPIDLEKYPKEVQDLLDEVYQVYGCYSASYLRTMTHAEPPWKNTPRNEEITHSLLIEYFKTQIH